MGIVEEETAGEWDEEKEEEEEKEEKKKKKGMCAKLLKFFASLGGQIYYSTMLLQFSNRSIYSSCVVHRGRS